MLTQTFNVPEMSLKSYKAYCISNQKAVPQNEHNFDNLHLSSSYYENYKEMGRLNVTSALGVSSIRHLNYTVSAQSAVTIFRMNEDVAQNTCFRILCFVDNASWHNSGK
jgi:hypothetical protein